MFDTNIASKTMNTGYITNINEARFIVAVRKASFNNNGFVVGSYSFNNWKQSEISKWTSQTKPNKCVGMDKNGSYLGFGEESGKE